MSSIVLVLPLRPTLPAISGNANGSKPTSQAMGQANIQRHQDIGDRGHLIQR
ncbi:MAG: hypothetical protein ACFB4J_00560 [Elainellaceae cyanobacterium]